MPKNNQLLTMFNVTCIMDFIHENACYWTKGQTYACQTPNFVVFLVESNFGQTELVGKGYLIDDFFAYFETDHKIENLPFADTFLSDTVKNNIYRSEWKKNVVKDVKAHIEDLGIDFSDIQIDCVAHRYVYQNDYDPNLSYWANIDHLLAEESHLMKQQLNVSDDVNMLNLSRVVYLKQTDERRQSSLWYGGDIVRINHEKNADNYLVIRAEGDVDIEIKKIDDIILSVRDKNCNGAFGNELLSYIHDDAELYLLLANNHPLYTATFNNNNWWEVMAMIHGQRVDLDIAMDTDNLAEVIQSVLDDESAFWEKAFCQNCSKTS